MIKFQKFPTNREHTQKSFIDLNLDENLPLSLSLSLYPPKLNVCQLYSSLACSTICHWNRPTHPTICTTLVYKAALKSHMISGFLL
jgi:hypothetical protein